MLPAIHTVPAVGYAVRGSNGWWTFSGDTCPNPAFWQRINQLSLAMLVIETAFSNHENALAQRSLHLAPNTLAQELAQLQPGRPCPIYITHTKPSGTELIMEEIRRFSASTPHRLAAAHAIRGLETGDEIDVLIGMQFVTFMTRQKCHQKKHSCPSGTKFATHPRPIVAIDTTGCQDTLAQNLLQPLCICNFS